jgi:hypothetical protein
MVIILWLIGTTRTISSILVTVDGTFICGGIIVMFLAIDAGSEENAFTFLTKLVIRLAYPVRVKSLLHASTASAPLLLASACSCLTDARPSD